MIFQVLLEAKDIKGEVKDGVDWDLVTKFDGEIEDILNKQIKERYPKHK